MDIDNSRQSTFQTCPYLYQEKYLTENTGLEKIQKSDTYTPLMFGGRMHQLWEVHYGSQLGLEYDYPAHPVIELENEAQAMMVGYRNHYPNEDFIVVDVEREFRIPIPGTNHNAVGKIDVVMRSIETGRLNIMDHKSQNRTSKSNLPQKWAARAQASIYLWAARQLYNEPIDNFFVNIAVRQSPAGREPAYFPDRQKLERTQEQINKALIDLVAAADSIESYKTKFGNDPWPSATEQCYTWGQCDFYLPHTYGWSQEIREKMYQPREEYINIAGIKVFQPHE